ncbi:MAG TPA: hypothetical protein VJL30_01730 [Patescibacteria group bacterium]|nr:hypothetical protein [Patescibacteria group bacterium]
MCQPTATLVVTVVEIGARTITTTCTVPQKNIPSRVKAVLEDAIMYSPPESRSLLVLSKTVACQKCARVISSRTICWRIVSGKDHYLWLTEFSIMAAYFKTL